MSKKEILSGNQAIARGFYEAGGMVATAYPGSPTVDVIESMKSEYSDDIYSEFSMNEKVALEVGIGSCYGGLRTLVTMKHVGVNICMDPLMSFTQSPIDAGFMLVSGDDPGMSSSQNEQDNRILGKFANMAIFDPADSQDAKDYVKAGLDISEEYQMPVMMRITSRICHARSLVEIGQREEKMGPKFSGKPSLSCMLPPHTFKHQYTMKERIEKLQEAANDLSINKLEEYGSDSLVITSGICYYNFKEVCPDVDVLKLGMVYPLPIDKIKNLAKKYSKVIGIEEMMPFIENELKLNGIDCVGKEYFSFTNELHSEVIEEGLVKIGVLKERKLLDPAKDDTTARGPLFCAGCPHRPVFDILKKSKVTVVGDIGCYTMGLLYPWEVLKVNISMGASLGIIKGLRYAMDKQGDVDKPVVGVIGDGTFFHSGIPGFANLQYQLKGDENITMIVLDNATTAMTGGQPTGESFHMDQTGQDISIEATLRNMGFDDIQVIDQFNYKEAKEAIVGATKRKGVSVILTSRPCALRYKVKETPFEVDPTICIGCKTCIKTNCPPLRMKKYDGIEKLKSSIDPNQCVGCGICAQVCPVGAIKRKESK